MPIALHTGSRGQTPSRLLSSVHISPRPWPNYDAGAAISGRWKSSGSGSALSLARHYLSSYANN